MTNGLRPYPEYKPSGVDWLGDIPAHWDSRRIKALDPRSDTVQTGPFGAQLHASDYKDVGVPLILIRNITKHNWIDDRRIPRVSEEDAHRLRQYRLQVGDIVFSRVGSIARCALCAVREEGWLISGQTLRLRMRNQNVKHKFLLLFFVSEHVQEYMRLSSVGSTRESINVH